MNFCPYYDDDDCFQHALSETDKPEKDLLVAQLMMIKDYLDGNLDQTAFKAFYMATAFQIGGFNVEQVAGMLNTANLGIITDAIDTVQSSDLSPEDKIRTILGVPPPGDE